MKINFWIVVIIIETIALAVAISMTIIYKDLRNFYRYEANEIFKLNSSIQDMKEKNNDTCVRKYYEIENTLNKIKVKLRI